MDWEIEIASVAPAGTGKVSIAGAGPGDPDLLTVKTLRLLRTAPAIVHDALISGEIRALFSTSAKIYDVGKRAGHPGSASQHRINRLLLMLAGAGLDVLRLKGGDPLIFGRGGEEALFLREHGIPFEIVPGVSAMNGAAAAGIPLTHRGLSGSCIMLNGFAPYLESIDWEALVALGGSWVFYMGGQSLREIARHLLIHGADPGLSLGLIESATTPRETVTVMPLQAAAQYGAPLRDDAPGLVIVGPTVDLIHQISPSFMEFHGELSAIPCLSEVAGQGRVDRGWR